VEILETKSSAAYWQALYLRRLWAWGIRPGDRILRMLQTISPSSISFFIGGSPLARLFRKEVRLLDMRPGTNTQLLKEIMESRINVLLAQPSTLLAIIKIMEENGLSLSLKTVITTGENLTPAMRKRIQDTFHCEVYDQYSTV
jgi:phenylacetate-coenzyme A ligase PaaK-like adenylate-forming protein